MWDVCRRISKLLADLCWIHGVVFCPVVFVFFLIIFCCLEEVYWCNVVCTSVTYFAFAGNIVGGRKAKEGPPPLLSNVLGWGGGSFQRLFFVYLSHCRRLSDLIILFLFCFSEAISRGSLVLAVIYAVLCCAVLCCAGLGTWAWTFVLVICAIFMYVRRVMS